MKEIRVGVTTIIRCAGGETITLTLDTTLPRFCSRNFSIHGTNAMYDANTKSIFCGIPRFHQRKMGSE